MTSGKYSPRLGVSSMLRFTTCVFAILISALAWGQEPAKVSEDHQPSIQGIELGMNAQQLLDKLGRMPDSRKDDKNEVVLSWKQDKGNILQVHFRGEHVSYIGLEYRPPRPTNDFNLQPHGESLAADPRTRSQQAPDTTGGPTPVVVGSVRMGGNEDKAPVMGHNLDPNAITGRDPRIHPEYKVAETNDRERTVWNRLEKDPRGYRVEIGFISTDRKKMGSQYEGQVQFKYVSVEKEDLKKFDEAMKSAK
jgi:hypothetical protein